MTITEKSKQENLSEPASKRVSERIMVKRLSVKKRVDNMKIVYAYTNTQHTHKHAHT